MLLILKSILFFHICSSFYTNFSQDQQANTNQSDEIIISSSLDLFQYKDTPIRLSILIATIEKRHEKFEKIYQKVLKQIIDNQLEHKVEILYFKDNQTITLGAKRNELVNLAKGEYVCFLDDDDDVSDDYVELIYEALKTNPDCVSCVGVLYMPNRAFRKFIHSLKYHYAFLKDATSYSPVYHLNPIKRSIAIQIKFPEQNYNEDTTWSKRLQNSKLLQTEADVKDNKPIYFYLYNPATSEAIPDQVRKNRNKTWNAKGQVIVKKQVI